MYTLPSLSQSLDLLKATTPRTGVEVPPTSLPFTGIITEEQQHCLLSAITTEDQQHRLSSIPVIDSQQGRRWVVFLIRDMGMCAFQSVAVYASHKQKGDIGPS